MATRAASYGETEKRCSRCLDWWPNDLEFYHRDARQKDGLTTWCRACWSEHQGERRAVARSTSATRGTAGDPTSVSTSEAA